MSRTTRTTQIFGLVAGMLTVSAAGALARPPVPSSSLLKHQDPPLVGRVRTREGVIDLTRASVSEGGAAHDVAQGTAGVIADAEVFRTRDHALRNAATPAGEQHAP